MEDREVTHADKDAYKSVQQYLDKLRELYPPIDNTLDTPPPNEATLDPPPTDEFTPIHLPRSTRLSGATKNLVWFLIQANSLGSPGYTHSHITTQRVLVSYGIRSYNLRLRNRFLIFPRSRPGSNSTTSLSRRISFL